MFASSSAVTLPFPASQPPQSLCILRLSAIGDTTHMVPIVRAIQQHWPACKITWVIGKLEHQLLQHMDGVEFIIFDKSSGLTGLREFRQRMRRRRFDLLLHMQAALRASMVARCVPASARLGFDRARAIDGQWLFSSHKIEPAHHAHVLEGFLGFLRAAGIDQPELDWRFPLPAEVTEQAQSLCPSDNFVVINACSSDRKNNWRNWPVENYAPVIDYIQQRGLSLVLSGGPADAEIAMAKDIAAYCNDKVINLVGKTSLPQLLAVLGRARALIAPDTGPAHMGNLAGIPVIGLYASSNPRRTGPYRQPEFIVNRYPQALERYMNKTEAEVKWGQRVREAEVMSLITAEDVIEKLVLADI